MIHEPSFQATQAARFDRPGWIRPLYDSYCFSNLPATITHLLTGADPSSGPTLPLDLFDGLSPRYQKVVLFYIDALGWKFVERYLDRHPWLQRIAAEGVVARLTSQFPSTTVPHVTCIHSGLPVGQSGAYEWFYYEPSLDALIAPLMFSFAGDADWGTLAKAGADPRLLAPNRSLYADLAAQGVQSFIFQHKSYTPSPYTGVIFAGAKSMPFVTLPEALVNVAALLERASGPTYVFLYFDAIDTIGHRYGPDSPQFDAEVEFFLAAMEHIFFPRVQGTVRDTLFLLTTDHGQVQTDPAQAIYLNHVIPGIEQFIRRNRQGQLLVPGGSPRDMFLYLKDDRLDDGVEHIQRVLAGRATVYKVADLMAAALFGPPPLSDRFLSRVGNAVILAHDHEAVWWYEKDRFEQKFYGHHGGLSRDEMEIPLLIFNL